MRELSFHFEFDEHGVGDGVKMALALIREAIYLLAPYVDGDCHKTAMLFDAAANVLMLTIDEDSEHLGFIPGMRVAVLEEVADDDEAIKKHLYATKERTEDLLAVARGLVGTEQLD